MEYKVNLKNDHHSFMWRSKCFFLYLEVLYEYTHLRKNASKKRKNTLISNMNALRGGMIPFNLL